MIENLIFLNTSIIISASIFDDYFYQKNELKFFFFYNYLKIIFWVKYSIKQRGNILFDKYYSNLLFQMQQSSTFLECNTLVNLIRFLSTNKNSKNAI